MLLTGEVPTYTYIMFEYFSADYNNFAVNGMRTGRLRAND